MMEKDHYLDKDRDPMDQASQLVLLTSVVEFRGEGDELESRCRRNDGSACGTLLVMGLEVG
jgi:hypothetical protein